MLSYWTPRVNSRSVSFSVYHRGNNYSSLPLMMADFLDKSTFFIVSIFLCCVRTSPASLTTMAGGSLKPGDVLNSTTQLCSAANIFCLEFANFNNSGSVFSYLVIHKPPDDGWTVWVGNRNEPVVNNSGELTLDESGKLKIVSQGIPIKVLYSPNHPINSTVATLFDNGNFILHQLLPNGSNTLLWQSFDYPSDRLIPEMKLGINHKTGHKWSLTSWISRVNAASGDFTLEWEPQRRELIIQRRGVTIWRSGILRKNGSFENIPNKLIHRFKVVANEDEDYFTLTAPHSTKQVSFLCSNYDGRLYDGFYTVIAMADKCYGFNNDGGCQLYDAPKCWQHAEAGYGYINFTDIQNVKNDTNSSFTRLDCQRSCWNDCDCVGYSTIYRNTTGCTFLYKQAIVITTLHPSNNVQLIFLLSGPLHPKGKSSNNSTLTDAKNNDPTHIAKKGKRKWIWIGVVIATSLFIICLFILCVALRKRKIQLKEKKRESPETVLIDLLASNESTSVNELQDSINKGHELRVFSYASIMDATNGFSSENILGEGGFGPVYKGILPTGKEVAIKRLSKTSGQGVAEFKNELTLICELQHINLVQLVGCCIHEEERMLIYEFMPNKSLDFFLFDSSPSKLLDWQKRLNIIEGIAQGLLYLHKYSRLKIIRRDLKASNILLDKNMNPKISDFGMVRIFTQQESKSNTHRIVGTYGYMAPEYVMDGVFSVKSDVYSFGVLLLEIVSGRRNNSFYNVDGPLTLIAHAWELWKGGVALELMDQTLIDSYVYDEVMQCIHIGLLCVEEDANDRPTMSNIISMLINRSATLSLPKRPAFYTRKMFKVQISSKESNTYSINEITISEFDAR